MIETEKYAKLSMPILALRFSIEEMAAPQLLKLTVPATILSPALIPMALGYLEIQSQEPRGILQAHEQSTFQGLKMDTTLETIAEVLQLFITEPM